MSRLFGVLAIAVLDLACSSEASDAITPLGDASTFAETTVDAPADAAETSVTDTTPIDTGACLDECPAPNGGVTWGCRKRFLYGLNYAWRHFGADFGGIAKWGQKGVASDSTGYDEDLADMRAHGVGVVRWWMFPELRGEGVTVDASDTPNGLGPTTLADVGAALDLAAKNDLHVMFTLFSFDGFRPTRTDSGLRIPGLTGTIKNAARRKSLVDNVVRPIAKAVQASTHKDRVIAWDVINEPEWAMTGSDPYGDPAFEPNAELAPVTHAEMAAFIAEVVAALRSESSAQLTVGAAAFKWAKAWSKIDQDFYQFHMYDWIDRYWPYSKKPAELGLGDKPLVMGEFPLGPLGATPYGTVVDAWWANGYAGAMAWQYIESTSTQLSEVKVFADKHTCETTFK